VALPGKIPCGVDGLTIAADLEVELYDFGVGAAHIRNPLAALYGITLLRVEMIVVRVGT
jgi:hypothetical protein